ncbi:MAG TPA: flagellar basal body-associated FliL family protein [Candidatus Acidoferrum sp.]|nr:flagellar basal body-associated FliL family protein [Candidatus Acidoferrum sp.]
MAAEEEKTVVASGEAPAAEKKKGPNKLILFGGIGLGVVVIGVVLALFVLKPMMSGGDSKAGAPAKGASTHETKKAELPPAKSKEKKAESGAEGSALVYAIKDIVVNPAGTGGTRFLSVSFGFDVRSKELAAAMEQREPLVRDVLITILSSKTVAELTDPKQKEIMRLQIRKRLSQVLQTEDLAGVYYTDFVLQ